MFRYFAFSWNPSDQRSNQLVAAYGRRLRAHRPDWKDAFAIPGFLVLTADAGIRGNEIRRFADNRGVLLGTLFTRTSDESSNCSPNALAADISRRVCATFGRELIDRFWGEYIAFIAGESAPDSYVLRSPMGSLPCFTCSQGELCIYFSDQTDYDVLGIRHAIDWEYVAAAVRFRGTLATERTGLRGISEVRAGECLVRLGATTKREFYWDPIEIAINDPFEDPERATEELRIATRQCTNAVASHHKGILHLLSGGVDSSIVLSCLARSPTASKVVCLNYYSPGSNSDERDYARAAATRAGCSLLEQPRNSTVSLEPLLSLRATSPTPAFYLGYIESSQLEADIARSQHATAVCSGVGGDQLFYQGRAGFAVGEVLRRRGFGRAALRTSYHAALLEKKSLWEVLRTGFSDAFLHRRWHPRDDAPQDRQFMTVQAFQDSNSESLYVHPWFQRSASLTSGKRFHIYTLCSTLFYYNPFGRPDDPVHLAPLLCQPLVEVALRIPTFLLILGGWDRSLARRAFSTEVPEQIIWRRSKGGMEEHMREMMVRNLPLIRSMLLDGQLVKGGLLDRDRIDGFLALKPTKVCAGMPELYEYLSLEAWLQSVSLPLQAAA